MQCVCVCASMCVCVCVCVMNVRNHYSGHYIPLGVFNHCKCVVCVCVTLRLTSALIFQSVKYVTSLHTHTHTCVHTRAHTHTHTHTHTHAHTLTHTYKNIWTDTNTHTHTQRKIESDSWNTHTQWPGGARGLERESTQLEFRHD